MKKTITFKQLVKALSVAICSDSCYIIENNETIIIRRKNFKSEGEDGYFKKTFYNNDNYDRFKNALSLYIPDSLITRVFGDICINSTLENVDKMLSMK